MARYSKELKASIIQKMMPPNNVSVSQLKKDTGITDATLYTWRKQAKAQGVPVPGDGKNPEQWSAEDKFSVLMETASLNTAELSLYCRKTGVFAEQIAKWKQDFMAGSKQPAESRQALRASQQQDKKRIRELDRELLRKDRALAETAALLVLSKKARAIWGGGSRGRLIPHSDRKEAVGLINEAVSSGARKIKACPVIGLTLRTFQRWTQEQEVMKDRRKDAVRPLQGNALTDEERQAVLDVCNSERFKSQPPTQIVPTLADEGRYLASESTFYRILKDADQQHHRGRSKKPGKRKPTSHCATGPNPMWSWDTRT